MKKALICILIAVLLVFAAQRQVRESVLLWLDERFGPAELAEEAPEQSEPLFAAASVPQASDMLDVTLYYRFAQTDVLGMELAQIDVSRDETIARSIVERLVEGPDAAHGRLTGVFPQGTRVLSVVPEGTTVYVTLSDAFLGRPDGAPADWEDLTVWQEEATLRRWLAAQSLVCALTEGGRYQRVQLCVAQSDDDAPLRIPLYYFNRQGRDMSIVLAACTRDEATVLTPQRAMQMILDGWQRRDWERVFELLCPTADEALPTLSAFEAQMREADVSLLKADISGGSVDAVGTTATLVLDGAIRSQGGDAQMIRESVPLRRHADNWAMTLETLRSLMIRE